MADFDYALAAQFWGLAFGSVVSFYLLAHGVGLVLRFIRES